MATCAQLRAQLVQLDTLLQSRGETAMRLQGPTCTSLVRKTALLTDLDTEQSLELMELGEKALGEHATSFEHALTTRLELGLVAEARTTATGQTLEDLDAFFTAQDYRDCNATSSPMQRELCVANRLSALGIHKMHPRTIRAAIAALVHFESDITLKFPAHDAIYEDVQNFARNFPPKPAPSHALNVYPRSPSELPPHVYEAAYTADDPPVPSMLPRFRVISLGHVPLRSTSKLLSWNQTQLGGRRAQCRVDPLAVMDTRNPGPQRGALRGDCPLIRFGRSSGHRDDDRDAGYHRDAGDHHMTQRMAALQDQVRELQSKRDAPSQNAICDGSMSDGLKPKQPRSRVSPEGLSSLYAESAARQDKARELERDSSAAADADAVTPKAKVGGDHGPAFGTEEGEERQLAVLLEKEKRVKADAAQKRKDKVAAERDVLLKRPASAVATTTPAKKPKSTRDLTDVPSASKGAKRARGADDPWLALGQKSLKPSLAHILCDACKDISPSIGAFCTRGSAAGRALAKNKKGMDADGIKAAGAHGWALCRQYWLAND